MKSMGKAKPDPKPKPKQAKSKAKAPAMKTSKRRVNIMGVSDSEAEPLESSSSPTLFHVRSSDLQYLHNLDWVGAHSD